MNNLTPIALSLILGWLPASAQATPEAAAPRPQRPAMMGARVAARLQLSEAQKTAIKEIRAKHQAAIETQAKAVKEANKAFAEAAQKPETTTAALKALHQTLSDQAFALKVEHRAMRLEIRALLTPEQREQAAKMEGQRQGMRMARRGGRMGFGGGMPGDGQGK